MAEELRQVTLKVKVLDRAFVIIVSADEDGMWRESISEDLPDGTRADWDGEDCVHPTVADAAERAVGDIVSTVLDDLRR